MLERSAAYLTAVIWQMSVSGLVLMLDSQSLIERVKIERLKIFCGLPNTQPQKKKNIEVSLG